MRRDHKWWVMIGGPEEWFPQFAARFCHPDFEVGLEIWEVGGRAERGFCLATARMDEITELENARELANSEVRMLAGLARLFWEGIPPVEAKRLLRVKDGKFVEGALLGVPGIAILQGNTPIGIEEDLLDTQGQERVLRSEVVGALQESDVARALEIYGRELPNWGSLYKTYELLKKRFGDDRLCATGVVNKSQLDRFGASANLPALSGIDARHAAKAGDAPKAMDLSEAHQKIRKLLGLWLSGHLEAVRPGG